MQRGSHTHIVFEIHQDNTIIQSVNALRSTYTMHCIEAWSLSAWMHFFHWETAECTYSLQKGYITYNYFIKMNMNM